MDITNPAIIRVNNRNYRCLHPTNLKQRARQPKKSDEKRVFVDEYDDEEIYIEDFAITEPSNMEDARPAKEDDFPEDSIDQEVSVEDKLSELMKSKQVRVDLENGKYVCSIHVPIMARGYVMGKNGGNIKDICKQTKVEIEFPEKHRADDPILIFGISEQAALSAYLKINELVELKRNSRNLTHFLAIKCDSDEVKANYEKFKEIVISKHLPQGFPEKVFIGAGKLHLTITILTLLDNFERNKMVSFMNKSLTKVIKEVLKDRKDATKSFHFTMAGLDYMNDDPSSVKVLYAKIQNSAQLIQTLADQINTVTNETGFSAELRPKVKLHMTLMNTRYTPKHKSFDATTILKELKNFSFGSVELSHIHLLISGTVDERTGGYKSTHKISVF